MYKFTFQVVVYFEMSKKLVYECFGALNKFIVNVLWFLKQRYLKKQD